MRFVVHVLAALGLLLAAAAPSYAACGDNPGDAAAVAATRAQIAQQCPCSSFKSHGAYVRCASGVASQAVNAGTLSEECAEVVVNCAGNSTCGTRGAVTCCQTDATGATTCSVKSRASACKAPAGAYRGAGQPEAVFAIERAMDHLAQTLRIDPGELRRRNFVGRDEFPWEVGTASAQVPVTYDSGDYEGALDAALELARYEERRAAQAVERGKGEGGRLLGIGIAAYVLLTGLGPHEGAVLRVDPGEGVLLVTGASPHGQGTATMLAQVVADELGVQPHEVVVRHGDTALIPFGVGTYASRNAVVAGNAALIAARAVATKARRLAAHLLEVSDADLELADSVVRVVGAPDRCLSLAELARACAPGAPLPDGMDPGLEATHYFPAPRATFASGVHVATVEIERETGRIEILDYTVVSDAGRVINPLIVEGQIHGGVAQGVGGALYEELVYDDHGQPRTQSLLEYVMPTAEQVPSMRIANLITPSPLNPLGVKGVGEAGALAPPAAIAAAVEDALRPFGARITGTPLRPEDIFRLMR